MTYQYTDVVGKKVEVILDQLMPSGTNLVQNHGLKFKSGYYLLKVKINRKEVAKYPLIIK